MRTARLLGVAAAASSLFVALSKNLKPEQAICLCVVAAVDLVATYAARRRKNRIAFATTLAANAILILFFLAEMHENAWALALAILHASATIITLLPRQRVQSADDPLPALPLSWAWSSALAITISALALSPARQAEAAALTGVWALLYFTSLALISWTGRWRWLLLPVLALIACHIFADLVQDSVDDARKVAMVGGMCVHAALFDWLRSPKAALGRFGRTTVVVLGMSLVLPLISAPHELVGIEPIGISIIWAALFGLSSALAPRLAARRTDYPIALPQHRNFAHAAIPIVLGLAMGIAIVVVKPRDTLVAIIAVATSALALIRIRGTGTLTAYGLGYTGMFAVADLSRISSFIPFGWPVLVGLLAYWLSTEHARVAPRRVFVSFSPIKVASLGLAGATAATAAIFMAVIANRDPAWRGSLLGDLFGPVALFDGARPSVPSAPLAQDQSAPVGGAVAIDPLHRGTWIADEERDEVALIDRAGEKRTFRVGRWPEEIVVSPKGVVFVSCRQDGRIYTIDHDFRISSFEIGAEPRALALDESGRRLYVGLVTERALVSADTTSYAPIARLALDAEPHEIARTPNGIAVLSDKGSDVVFASFELDRSHSVPLYAAPGRRAWHGQALVPVGRDLIVLHGSIDTGLSKPSPSGGYGGSVMRPIEIVTSILRDEKPSIYPARDTWRMLGKRTSDITGAVYREGKLRLSSRGGSSIETLTLTSGQPPTRPTSIAIGAGARGLAVEEDGSAVTLAAFDRELLSIDTAEDVSKRSIGVGTMPEPIARGRRIFFDAKDQRISQDGVSCATCHADGREDGLVWRLKGTLRQTPMLAGRLEGTAPFNWVGSSATLTDNIEQTAIRLGGKGFAADEEDRDALAAYLLHGLRDPVRPRAPRPDLVARGEKIFSSPFVGCASCHNPAQAFTDAGLTHDVGATTPREIVDMLATGGTDHPEKMDVPSLRFVGLTAPYYHNGSKPSLEALIADNGDRMGDTRALDEEDKQALVAYLRSL